MPSSVKDFATLVRKKYNAYDDVDDDELVNLFLKKYPVYRDQITFEESPVISKPSPEIDLSQLTETAAPISPLLPKKTTQTIYNQPGTEHLPPLEEPGFETPLQSKRRETILRVPTLYETMPEEMKPPERIKAEQDFARMIRKTPLPKPEYQKREEFFDKVTQKLPTAMMAVAAPYSMAIYELVQQLKSAGVSIVKDEKYSPLEPRALTELLPEGTNPILARALSVAEYVGDIALFSTLGNLAGKKILDRTIELAGKKMMRVGMPKAKVEEFLSAIKQGAQNFKTSPEREMARLKKVKKAKFPTKMIDLEGVPPQEPIVPPAPKPANIITRPLTTTDQRPGTFPVTTPPVSPEPVPASVIPPTAEKPPIPAIQDPYEMLNFPQTETIKAAIKAGVPKSKIAEENYRDGLTGLLKKDVASKTTVPDGRLLYDVDGTGKDVGGFTFDIDHFKSINDTFGHPAGNLVLRKTGELALKHDLFAIRTGGEEFQIPLFRKENPLEVAERIKAFMDDIAENISIADEQGNILQKGITVSIGFGTDSAKSDKISYRAKNEGRNLLILDKNAFESYNKIEGTNYEWTEPQTDIVRRRTETSVSYPEGAGRARPVPRSPGRPERRVDPFVPPTAEPAVKPSATEIPEARELTPPSKRRSNAIDLKPEQVGTIPEEFQIRDSAYSKERVNTIVSEGWKPHLYSPIPVIKRQGKYYVGGDGHSRLEAIKQLKEEGAKIPDKLEFRLVTENEARELRYANLKRTNVHILDETKAFKEMIDSGQTAQDIAKGFGVGNTADERARYVAKVLSLDMLNEEMKRLLRQNMLQLPHAFVITNALGKFPNLRKFPAFQSMLYHDAIKKEDYSPTQLQSFLNNLGEVLLVKMEQGELFTDESLTQSVKGVLGEAKKAIDEHKKTITRRKGMILKFEQWQKGLRPEPNKFIKKGYQSFVNEIVSARKKIDDIMYSIGQEKKPKDIEQKVKNELKQLEEGEPKYKPDEEYPPIVKEEGQPYQVEKLTEAQKQEEQYDFLTGTFHPIKPSKKNRDNEIVGEQFDFVTGRFEPVTRADMRKTIKAIREMDIPESEFLREEHGKYELTSNPEGTYNIKLLNSIQKKGKYATDDEIIEWAKWLNTTDNESVAIMQHIFKLDKAKAQKLLGKTGPRSLFASEAIQSYSPDTPKAPDFVADSAVETILEEVGFLETTAIENPQPADIVAMIYNIKERATKKESFWTIFLDENNRQIGVNLTSMGTLNSTIVHPREVMNIARSVGAKSIIITHNHPSSDVSPSQEDRDLTMRLTGVAKEFGIEMKYHVITEGDKYGLIEPSGVFREDKYIRPEFRSFKTKMFELAQKRKEMGLYGNKQIKSPQDMIDVIKEIGDKSKNTLLAHVLNIRGRIEATVAIGTSQNFWNDAIMKIQEAAVDYSGASVILSAPFKLRPEFVRETSKKMSLLGIDFDDTIIPEANYHGYYSYKKEAPWLFEKSGKPYMVAEPNRNKMIAKAQILKQKLNLTEKEWLELKFKETKKQNLTEATPQEIGKVLNALQMINTGAVSFKEYMSPPKEWETSDPPSPKPPQITDVEKFFGIDIPFPEVPVMEQVEPVGKAKRALQVVGFPSRGEILKQTGEAGKALFKEVEMYRDKPSETAGIYKEQLKKIEQEVKLTKEDRQNLLDVLQGAAKPANDKVQKYFEKINEIMSMIRDLKEKQIEHDPFQEKLKIPRKEKERWGLKNYFPHYIPPKDDFLKPGGNLRAEVLEDAVRRGDFKDMAEATKALDEWIQFNKTGKMPLSVLKYLVDKKQANTIEEAALLLQRMRIRRRREKFGPFEQREVDLPFYDPNPLRVLPRYINGAMHELYSAARFGENGERLWALLERFNVPGGNREVADTVVNHVLGLSKPSDVSDFFKFIRNAQVISKMTWSAIANFWQGPLGVSLVSSPKVAWMAHQYVKNNFRESVALATRVGQQPQMALLFTEDLGDWARKWLQFTLFTKTEVNNYILSSVAGKIGAVHYFDKLKANPKDDFARYQLNWLGINVKEALKRGVLSEPELAHASNKMWRESQAIPDILNMPHRWLGIRTDSPEGKTVMQFKTVAYNQTRIVWEHAVKQAARGHPLALLTLLILFPTVGEIIQDIRAIPGWRQRPKGVLWRYLDNLVGAFSYGILQDIFYMSKFGALSFGATASFAADVLGAAGEIAAYKKGWSSTKRTLRHTPVIGLALYSAIKGRPKQWQQPKNLEELILPERKPGESFWTGEKPKLKKPKMLKPKMVTLK